MLNKLITILILLTIFISSIIFFWTPFEGHLIYIVFIVLLPIFVFKFGFPRLPFLIFFPLLIVGIVYASLGLNTYALFFKVFIGYFLSVLFYHYVMELYEFNVEKLFTLYMNAAYVVTIIGIIQIISYLIGFTPGYNFRWIFNKWSVQIGGAFGIRMNSVFSEPAYFAAVIAPAFLVAMYNIFKKAELFISKRKSYILFFAYFFTFSSLGMMGFFIAVLLLLFNFGFYRYAILVIPLAFLSYTLLYNNIDDFKDRVDGTVEIFSTQDIYNYDIHGSSFVLYNNYHIASENFKHNFLFGTGLGSHPIAFDKYSLTNVDRSVQIENNKADANSMFLRLMSETGIYGMVFMIGFLIRCYVPKKKTKDDVDWIISNALLLIILLYLIRQGHYFLNGFPFFLWMYYYNWKHVKNKSLIPVTEEVASKNTQAPLND